MLEVYGKNACVEILKNNKNINHIYILEKEFYKFENYLKEIDTNKISSVKKDFLDKKTNYKNHQGILISIDDYKTVSLEELYSLDRIIILDGINDPNNFGAILRSMDAFSYKGCILPNNNSVPITDVVCRVSTGAIEYINICYVNSLTTALLKLKENGFWIVSTDANGKDLFSNINKDLKLCIVIGSEGFGISKTIKKQSDYILKIEMDGHVNSLNASVSAGIIMYNLKK